MVQPSELTEDEAQLYDRQIRLWGLDSQKRLRGAKILIIGLQGLGAEVCKNIVLAGVKSVTLLDHENLTEEDTCAQFLAPRDLIGKNRAEASLTRAQNLNPLVQVKADTNSVDEKDEEFFKQFDLIIATNCQLERLLWLDQICRQNKIKFLCGDVFGLFGYFFVDLLSHEYSEEVTNDIPLPIDSTKKSRKVKSIKVTVKKTADFVPLSKALDVDWNNDIYKPRLNRMDFSYFLMLILLNFRKEFKRNPKPALPEDIESLKQIRDSVMAKLQVPAEKVPDSIFNQVFAQISPACAIVGGVLSQEVIKAVSLKEAPHNNLFFFNPTNNLGQILSVGNE